MLKNKFARAFGVAVAVTAISAQQAFAAVPAEVTAALDAAKEDGVTVAGVVLVVIIAIAAFKFIRRAL
jgi:uncharacterized membrane protein